MSFRKDMLESDRLAAAAELHAARKLQEKKDSGDAITEAEQAQIDAAYKKACAISDRLAAERHDDAVYATARRMSDEIGLAPIGGPPTTKTGRRRAGPPLTFTQEMLQKMHHAVRTGGNFSSSAELAAKGYSSVDSLLPPQLWPTIIGPEHPDRLLDRLPSAPIEAPSLEYLVHSSTTGAPAIVAEGAQKPELIFTSTKTTATVQKIACHAAVSYESMEDFVAFTDYVMNEATRQAIDVENAELLNGDGTAGHLTGLCKTSGILAHAVVTPETGLDGLEIAITNLKVGPQLAVADLVVMHPSTWSSIRRSKDLQNRYIVAPDPTVAEASSVWGCEVLTTTVMPTAEALVLDTTRFGRVLVREPLGIKIGTNNDDFTKNLSRFVIEERLTLAVERPGALLLVTGL